MLIWNYHDNNEQKPAEPVSLQIDNIPVKSVKITHYRIDDTHSNSYEVWKKMGSPQSPSAAQIKELEKAGQLAMLGAPKNVAVKAGKVQLDFDLPRLSVSFIKLDW